MTEFEIPEPPVGRAQLAEMQDLLGRVVARLVTLEKTTAQLGEDVAHAVETTRRQDHEPADWVWFPPPEPDPDPRARVRAFVDYYNGIYLGRTDSRARHIPDCWEQHPGLAMELATLAATWRAANIGSHAHPREAQYWHHQWRPGALDRMLRDWLHPDCLDGEHTPAGPTPGRSR